MTNFFASCELLCEECGEVSVANFKPIFPGEKLTDILSPKISTTYFPLKIFKFHHLELPEAFLRNIPCYREGANREKLTVKKTIINNEIFFSPFMSLINREKSAQTVKKSAPNREEIGTKNPPFFHH